MQGLSWCSDLGPSWIRRWNSCTEGRCLGSTKRRQRTRSSLRAAETTCQSPSAQGIPCLGDGLNANVLLSSNADKRASNALSQASHVCHLHCMRILVSACARSSTCQDARAAVVSDIIPPIAIKALVHLFLYALHQAGLHASICQCITSTSKSVLAFRKPLRSEVQQGTQRQGQLHARYASYRSEKNF